jgi:hypothetical protein
MENEMVTDEIKDIVISNPVGYMLESIKSVSIIKPDEMKFLIENKEHLWKVAERSWIWRTEMQKRSIISDIYHPTLHGKFHQTMAEMKVQLDQSFYLAKAYEEKKLEMETLEIDLEELEEKIITGDEQGLVARDIKRLEIQKKKLQIDIQFKNYELKQQEIAMHFRMDEVMGWKQLQDELLIKMKEDGMDDESIWNKETGEIEDAFFLFLNNLQGVKSSTDGGERNNLIALAVFGVQQAIEAGIYEKLLARCSPIQLDSINILKKIGAIR